MGLVAALLQGEFQLPLSRRGLAFLGFDRLDRRFQTTGRYGLVDRCRSPLPRSPITQSGPVTAKLCPLAIWKLPAISERRPEGQATTRSAASAPSGLSRWVQLFCRTSHFVKSQGSGLRKMHVSDFPVPLGPGRAGEMSKVLPSSPESTAPGVQPPQTRERGIFARWPKRTALDPIRSLGQLGACLLIPARWDLNRSSQSESRMQQIRASGLM